MDCAKIILAFLAITIVSVSGKTCGHKFVPINEAEEICCGGKVSSRYEGGLEQICCNGMLYPKNDGLCCKNIYRKYDFNELVDPVCCGASLMANQDTHLCCNDTMASRSDYACNKTWQIEILHRINQIACYKYDKPMDYVIHYNPYGSLECCGKQTITRGNQTHECINEEVLPKDRFFPCGKTKYLPKEEVCCEETGKLIPIPPNFKFNDGEIPNVLCMNNEFVDMNQMELVKAGDKKRVIPKGKTPCGNTYYNKTMKDPVVHCCDDVLIYNPAGSNVQCCGNKTYDPNRNTCCKNTILPLSESCCGNVPYKLSRGDVTCCQGTLINTDENLCCPNLIQGIDEIVKKGNYRHDSCCGSRSYDSGRNDCCGGNIVNRWNKNTHECKHGHVKEISLTEKIKDMIKDPKQKKDKEQTLKPICPMDSKTGDTCIKRYEFRFYVISQSKRDMNVVLLAPKSLEGMRLTLRNRNMRKCIKEQNSYSMFTNRDYRRRILSQDFKLSFTNRDVISKLRMVGTRMTPAIKCKIDRYYKERRS